MILNTFDKVRQGNVRIGIGVADNKEIIEADIETFDASGLGSISMFEDPVELANALANGDIDAAVRGTLPAVTTLRAIRTALDISHSNRVAMMEDIIGRIFFLYPIGVDEGWTTQQRVEAVQGIIKLLKRLGSPAKVAVLAGGRPEDRGRSDHVLKTLEAADKTVRFLKDVGIEAQSYGIQIEDALLSCNVIIAPDGISGNLIFRSMHYLGGCESHGAPLLNCDKVYVDTSRGKSSYFNSLMLAATLASSD